jgi:polar amino acid transport system permease protein
MSCYQTLLDYGLRSVGIGERLLPKSDFTLCEHFVLIGSGFIWGFCFGILALFFGFFIANAVAVAKASHNVWVRKPAEWFIFVFRGSPLFIQFFLAYESFVLLPRVGFDLPLGFTTITVETSWLTKAWLGALIVLTLNTAAYAGEIFYGALNSIPKGDIEAADAYGMSGWPRFRRVMWPTMMRLAWPSYTNEAIFLFQATTLVFFSGFPAFRQQGDALYYASYFSAKTFNPFMAYPVIALYFILITLALTWVFGRVNSRLNRHLPQNLKARIRLRPQLIR